MNNWGTVTRRNTLIYSYFKDIIRVPINTKVDPKVSKRLQNVRVLFEYRIIWFMTLYSVRLWKCFRGQLPLSLRVVENATTLASALWKSASNLDWTLTFKFFKIGSLRPI